MIVADSVIPRQQGQAGKGALARCTGACLFALMFGSPNTSAPTRGAAHPLQTRAAPLSPVWNALLIPDAESLGPFHGTAIKLAVLQHCTAIKLAVCLSAPHHAHPLPRRGPARDSAILSINPRYHHKPFRASAAAPRAPAARPPARRRSVAAADEPAPAPAPTARPASKARTPRPAAGPRPPDGCR